MSIKFHISFDVAAETIFEIIAKALPLDNLSVEELKPIVVNRFATEAKRLTPSPAAAELFLPERKRSKRKSRGPDLKRGINGIIMTELKDGPKRAVYLMTKIEAAGWSRNSVNSRLESLRRHGVVEPVGDGTWKLK